LTGHDEAVFAYTSEITPAGLVTHFLAGISNSTFAASGSSLAGTDLTPGANALEFGNHVDIATYAGNRNIPHTAHEELALLTAPVNWTSQSGSGDQSHDNVSPDAISCRAFRYSRLSVSPGRRCLLPRSGRGTAG
jgi:hypothetical protein